MGNSYAVFERIYWLIQKEEFFLKDYMDKFDISRRTAFRDLTYLKEYQSSVVSIGCASETLRGSFDYDKIKAFSKMASANDNYATLRSVNEQVRKFFKVKRYTYYTRTDRCTLKELATLHNWKDGFKAVVCCLGHFIFVCNDNYYSFFENENDKVVAVWELV